MLRFRRFITLIGVALVGLATNAAKVGEWTDFNNLVSGDYTWVKNSSCTVNADGSLTIGSSGGLTMALTSGKSIYSNKALTIIAEVENISKGSDKRAIFDITHNNNHVGLTLFTDGIAYQTWNLNNGYGNTGSINTGRHTIMLTYSGGSGTTTYIDGSQKANSGGLKTGSGNITSLGVGCYNTSNNIHQGMKIYSIILYDSKMSESDIAADIAAAKKVPLFWHKFDGNYTASGYVSLNFQGESAGNWVDSAQGKALKVVDGSTHPYGNNWTFGSGKWVVTSVVRMLNDASNKNPIWTSGVKGGWFGLVADYANKKMLLAHGDGSSCTTICEVAAPADCTTAYHLYTVQGDGAGNFKLSVDEDLAGASASSYSGTLPTGNYQIGSVNQGCPSGLARTTGTAIDDLRVYTYALTDDEIIAISREFNPKGGKYTATINKDSLWSELEWSPAEPEKGFAFGDELTINVTGSPKLVFDKLVSTGASLAIVGSPVVSMDDELYFDGCVSLSFASFSSLTAKDITFAPLKNGFYGEYSQTENALNLRFQNKEVISINIAGGSGGGAGAASPTENIVSGTDYYGIAPTIGESWNNIDRQWQNNGPQTVTISGAKAYDGNEIIQRESMSLAGTGKNTWQADITNPFLRGYLDDGAGVTVEVHGIPYEKYDVIVYATSDSNLILAPITVNGTEYTYKNGETTPGSDGWGAGLYATPELGKNALKVTNCTGEKLTISSAPRASNSSEPRGTFCAVQVINMGGSVASKDFEAELSGEKNFGDLTWTPSPLEPGKLNTATITVKGKSKLTIEDDYEFAKLTVLGEEGAELTIVKTEGKEFSVPTINFEGFAGKLILESELSGVKLFAESPTVRFNYTISGAAPLERGTLSYKDAALSWTTYVGGEWTLDMAANDNLTINSLADAIRPSFNMKVAGGAIVIDPEKKFNGTWFGMGTTRYLQTGGEVSFGTKGTGMSGTGNGVLLNYSGDGMELAISGGKFLAENTALNLHSSFTLDLSGEGLIKTKGVFASATNDHVIRLSDNAVFELGSLGWLADTATLTMSGGVFRASETTTMANAIAFENNAEFNAVENARLTIAGALIGENEKTNLVTKTGLGSMLINSEVPATLGLMVMGGELIFADTHDNLLSKVDVGESGTFNLTTVRPIGETSGKISNSGKVKVVLRTDEEVSVDVIKLFKVESAETLGMVEVYDSTGETVVKPVLGPVYQDGFCVIKMTNLDYEMPISGSVGTSGTWLGTTWKDAKGTTIKPEHWTQLGNAKVELTVTEANSTFVIDSAITNLSFTVIGADKTIVVSSDNKGNILNARKFDFSSVTKATLNFSSGSGEVVAGSNTILTQSGTGKLVVDSGNQATLENGSTMGSYEAKADATVFFAGEQTTDGSMAITTGAINIYENANIAVNGLVNWTERPLVRLSAGQKATIAPLAAAPALGQNLYFDVQNNGGTLTLGKGTGEVWFGRGGATFTQTAGKTVINAANYLLLNFGTGVIDMVISAGEFNAESVMVRGGSNNGGAKITLGGGTSDASMKAKGLERQSTAIANGLIFTLKDKGRLELGAGNSAADAVKTMVLDGGTLHTFASAIVSNDLSVASASTLSSAENNKLTIAGAISGEGALTIGEGTVAFGEKRILNNVLKNKATVEFTLLKSERQTAEWIKLFKLESAEAEVGTVVLYDTDGKTVFTPPEGLGPQNREGYCVIKTVNINYEAPLKTTLEGGSVDWEAANWTDKNGVKVDANHWPLLKDFAAEITLTANSTLNIPNAIKVTGLTVSGEYKLTIGTYNDEVNLGAVSVSMGATLSISPDFSGYTTISGEGLVAFNGVDAANYAKYSVRNVPYGIKISKVIHNIKTKITADGLLLGYEIALSVVTGEGSYLIFTAPNSAKFGSININFAGGRNGSSIIDDSKVSGSSNEFGGYPIAGTSWNDIEAKAYTANVTKYVNSDQVLISDAKITATISQVANPYTTGDDAVKNTLLYGYIDDGQSPIVSISNIPFEKYRVIVYRATDSADTTFSAAQIGTTAEDVKIYYGPTSGDTTGGITRSGATEKVWGKSNARSSYVEGVNYVVSDVLTGAAGSAAAYIYSHKHDGRAGVAAIQIVEVGKAFEMKEYKATIPEAGEYTFSELDWEPKMEKVTGSDAATITVDSSVTEAVSLTYDDPSITLGRVAFVSGEGVNINLYSDTSSEPENVSAWDESKLGGLLIYRWFVAQNLSSSSRKVAYGGGAGTDESRVVINHNGGALRIVEGDYYLKQSHSDTATTVSIKDANISYSDILGVGMATYEIGGKASITTPRVVLSQGAKNRTSVFTMGDNSKLQVTGGTNVDDTNSSIMFGHWNGPSTFTIKDNAEFLASGADILIGKTGNNHAINIEGGVFNVHGIKASASADGNNALNLNGGTLVVGSAGIGSYDLEKCPLNFSVGGAAKLLATNVLGGAAIAVTNNSALAMKSASHLTLGSARTDKQAEVVFAKAVTGPEATLEVEAGAVLKLGANTTVGTLIMKGMVINAGTLTVRKQLTVYLDKVEVGRTKIIAGGSYGNMDGVTLEVYLQGALQSGYNLVVGEDGLYITDKLTLKVAAILDATFKVYVNGKLTSSDPDRATLYWIERGSDVVVTYTTDGGAAFLPDMKTTWTKEFSNMTQNEEIKESDLPKIGSAGILFYVY